METEKKEMATMHSMHSVLGATGPMVTASVSGQEKLGSKAALHYSNYGNLYKLVNFLPLFPHP